MCEIWDWVANEGRNEIITLWNWLQDSGRGNEAVEMMNPANESLRKTLFAEYEFSTQKKQ